MALQFVEGMSQSPAVCFFCHGNPPDDEGNLQGAITDPLVDYDWGETPYICMECAGVIADLIDRVDESEHKKVVQERDDLQAQLEELNSEHEALKERVQRMVDGAKARKEAREQVKKKVKSSG